jgi:hypothetical protein
MLAMDSIVVAVVSYGLITDNARTASSLVRPHPVLSSRRQTASLPVLVMKTRPWASST